MMPAGFSKFVSKGLFSFLSSDSTIGLYLQDTKANSASG